MKKTIIWVVVLSLLTLLFSPAVFAEADANSASDSGRNNLFLSICYDVQGESTPKDFNQAEDYFQSFLSVQNAITKTQELLRIEPDTEDPTGASGSAPKSIVMLSLSDEGSEQIDQLLAELLTNPFVESAEKDISRIAALETPEVFCGENYTLFGADRLLLANTNQAEKQWNIGTLKESASRFGCQLVDANGEPFADDTLPVPTGAQILFPEGNPLMLEPQRVGVLGDGNGDGSVNTADARFALRMAVGLESSSDDSLSVDVLDTDLSGAVSTTDARTLLRYTVGLDDALMQRWNDAYGDMVRDMIFHQDAE